MEDEAAALREEGGSAVLEEVAQLHSYKTRLQLTAKLSFIETPMVRYYQKIRT